MGSCQPGLTGVERTGHPDWGGLRRDDAGADARWPPRQPNVSSAAALRRARHGRRSPAWWHLGRRGAVKISGNAGQRSPGPQALASYIVTRHRATTRRGAVVGSVLLGAASGLRSQLGVATVVARSDSSLPRVLRRPWTRRLLVAAAVGELVADKLPGTPSRLAPAGIAGRLALGAVAAALFARTRRAPWLPAAAIGAASAAVAAKLGHDARAQLAHHAPDPAVAVVEDALALGLAAAGASR